MTALLRFLESMTVASTFAQANEHDSARAMA